MLDAELDAHLDNAKHEKTKAGNYRNGHGKAYTLKFEIVFMPKTKQFVYLGAVIFPFLKK